MSKANVKLRSERPEPNASKSVNTAVTISVEADVSKANVKLAQRAAGAKIVKVGEHRS